MVRARQGINYSGRVAKSNAGVRFLISDRWIDRIVDVKRVNERIMCLKVLIGDKLVTCICAYAPQTGRSAESLSGIK